MSRTFTQPHQTSLTFVSREKLLETFSVLKFPVLLNITSMTPGLMHSTNDISSSAVRFKFLWDWGFLGLFCKLLSKEKKINHTINNRINNIFFFQITNHELKHERIQHT